MELLVFRYCRFESLINNPWGNFFEFCLDCWIDKKLKNKPNIIMIDMISFEKSMFFKHIVLCSSLSSVKAYHIRSKLICMIWDGGFFSNASCLSFLFMMKKFPLYSLFYICIFVVCILLKGYPRDWNLYISCIFSHPPLAQGLIFNRTALSCTTIEFKEIAKSSIF